VAAELEACHSTVIAVRAMCIRPHAVGAGLQVVGSIDEMGRLELLMPRLGAQHLAARAQQPADSRKQEVGGKRLQQYAVTPGGERVGYPLRIARGHQHRRRVRKLLRFAADFDAVATLEIQFRDDERGRMPVQKLLRHIQGCGSRDTIVATQSGRIAACLRRGVDEKQVRRLRR